jgi:hypothetical protein
VKCKDARCANIKCETVRCADEKWVHVRCEDVTCENVRCADVRCADVRCADARCDDLRCAHVRCADKKMLKYCLNCFFFEEPYAQVLLGTNHEQQFQKSGWYPPCDMYIYIHTYKETLMSPFC